MHRRQVKGHWPGAGTFCSPRQSTACRPEADDGRNRRKGHDSDEGTSGIQPSVRSRSRARLKPRTMRRLRCNWAKAEASCQPVPSRMRGFRAVHK